MLEHIHHPSELVQLSSPLQGEILEALWNSESIRQSQPRLAVETRDGTVELRGNVRSRAIKEIAADLARRVPGVREVINNLVTDTDLEIQAAAALVRDRRTRLFTDKIVVKSILGRVRLRGRVASEEIKVAAEELVAQIPGVHTVVNDLEAPPRLKPAPAAAKPATPVRPVTPPARPTAPPPAEPAPAAPAAAPQAMVAVAASTPVAAPDPAAPAPAAPALEVAVAKPAAKAKVAAGAPVAGARRDAAGRPISPHGKSAPKLSEERRKLVLAVRSR